MHSQEEERDGRDVEAHIPGKIKTEIKSGLHGLTDLGREQKETPGAWALAVLCP